MNQETTYESDMKEEKDDMPEWACSDVTPIAENHSNDADFLMMRLSSYFIGTAQNQLEKFVTDNIDRFFINSDDSSMHSTVEYVIYQEYTELFEEIMGHFTETYSKMELVNAIKTSNSLSSLGKESMGTLVMDLLDAVSSFEGKYRKTI